MPNTSSSGGYLLPDGGAISDQDLENALVDHVEIAYLEDLQRQIFTGQEGRLNFLGGFQDRPALPSDPDNVKVTVGGTVYSGRYTVLGSGGPRLGLSVGFGGSVGSDGSSNFGSNFSGAFGALHHAPPAASVTRPGNLIARIPGERDGWVMFAAHLDTVPHQGDIEPSAEIVAASDDHDHAGLRAAEGLPSDHADLSRLPD